MGCGELGVGEERQILACCPWLSSFKGKSDAAKRRGPQRPPDTLRWWLSLLYQGHRRKVPWSPLLDLGLTPAIRSYGGMWPPSRVESCAGWECDLLWKDHGHWSLEFYKNVPWVPKDLIRCLQALCPVALACLPVWVAAGVHIFSLPFQIHFFLFLRFAFCHGGGPLWTLPMDSLASGPCQWEPHSGREESRRLPRLTGFSTRRCAPHNSLSFLLSAPSLPFWQLCCSQPSFLHCPSGSPLPTHGFVLSVFVSQHSSNYPN